MSLVTVSENLSFLRAWMADPLRVAAVAPSGASLARLITSSIGPETGPILELGPGTGVFTRALLDRGVREEDLTLVEFGSDFARALAVKYPRARVLWMDASRIVSQPSLFEGLRVGAVVSGLPILSMSVRRQMAILSGCVALMSPGAGIFQFTYGPVCPVPRPLLARLGLAATRVGATACNLPPATVFRFGRAALA